MRDGAHDFVGQVRLFKIFQIILIEMHIKAPGGIVKIAGLGGSNES
jgi:hypothetical protein